MNLPIIRDTSTCAICGKKDGCQTVQEAWVCKENPNNNVKPDSSSKH